MNRKTTAEGNKKANVQELLKKKERISHLLSQWRKRKASCERKVKKYRTFKRKFSEEIQSLRH